MVHIKHSHLIYTQLPDTVSVSELRTPPHNCWWISNQNGLTPARSVNTGALSLNKVNQTVCSPFKQSLHLEDWGGGGGRLWLLISESRSVETQCHTNLTLSYNGERITAYLSLGSNCQLGKVPTLPGPRLLMVNSDCPFDWTRKHLQGIMSVRHLKRHSSSD